MNFYSKVEDSFSKKLPFAIYSKPNSSGIIGVFQKNNTLFSVQGFSEKGFVFVSFDLEQKIILPRSESDIVTVLKEKYQEENPTTISHHYTNETREKHEKLVQNAVQKIASGECKKIVVSRKEEILLTEVSLVAIFKKLIQTYATAFVYCFYHPKVGLWLGATPEQLLKVEASKVQTVALAGTKKIAEENLPWGEKEQVEQQLVTDYIINNLEDFVDNLEVSNPYTHKAGSLLHIKTDISAEIVDKHQFKNILEALHPTPAVCGFPKDKAKQFIIENEGYEREFYTGFLGELNFSAENQNSENSDLFVNLRCMKIEDNKAQIFVGGGITLDSNPEKEFLETVNKSEIIKRVI